MLLLYAAVEEDAIEGAANSAEMPWFPVVRGVCQSGGSMLPDGHHAAACMPQPLEQTPGGKVAAILAVVLAEQQQI